MQRCVGSPQVPNCLGGVFSPLTRKILTWAAFLHCHPDRQFREFIVKGLEEGFRIGYTRGNRRQSSVHNLLSCMDHPEVVAAYIEKECSLGRLLGPLPLAEAPRLHISPFGVIPKKGEDNWRLIVDLSAPHGASINDGIAQEWSSLAYVTIDMIADRISWLGQGTFLAKLDVKSAFRIIPVHPSDRCLLGMQWKNALFADAVLPFGLRSAPKLFNAVADALQFIARSQGIENVTHYLDDFVILGRPGTTQCNRDLKTLIDLCHCLGVPLANEKIEGPTEKLEVLGIIIDTVSMQLSLPKAKLSELHSLLHLWKGRKAITKREAQSLAGKLQHAATVVRPGRCFVRHIYELTSVKGGPNQLLRLNRQARSDIQWWLTFIDSWNGVSLFWKSRRSMPDIKVVSDASGSWGCGALSANNWFHFQWPAALTPLSIAYKELIPIVVASFAWGKSWAGKVVEFSSDNQAVVTILTKLYCRDLGLMSLLRCLVFCAATHNFWFTARHVPGRINNLADAISRNRVDLFLSQAPLTMKRLPENIDPEIIRLLCLQEPDWLCPDWMVSFITITQKD